MTIQAKDSKRPLPTKPALSPEARRGSRPTYLLEQKEGERELKAALHERVVPWLWSGELKIVLAHTPIHAPAGITVTPRRAPLLSRPRQRSSPPITAAWPQHGLHAVSHPYMGCVLEGEADLLIGSTREMAAGLGQDVRFGQTVLGLPSGSFFIIPPGSPYADGSQPHWERPRLETAASRILWLSAHDEGMIVHACRTQSENHSFTPGVFVRDRHSITFARLLIEAMHNPTDSTNDIARVYLLAMLLHLKQEWDTGAGAVAQWESSALSGAGETLIGAATVKRAADYIQTHIHAPLSLRHIAVHAYTSPSQLNRLFRSELGTSVMKYVALQRIEIAKNLLRDSNFPIHQVSDHAGFPHPSHFTRLFKRLTGISPSEFRLQARSSQNQNS